MSKEFYQNTIISCLSTICDESLHEYFVNENSKTKKIQNSRIICNFPNINDTWKNGWQVTNFIFNNFNIICMYYFILKFKKQIIYKILNTSQYLKLIIFIDNASQKLECDNSIKIHKENLMMNNVC